MIPIPPPKALKRAQGLCLRLNFLSLRKEQGLVGHGRLGGIFIEACCRTKEQRIEEVCDKVCEIAGAIDYMDRNTSKYFIKSLYICMEGPYHLLGAMYGKKA